MVGPTANLTVRLLGARSGTGTTSLLGLSATGISNNQGAVIRKEQVLDLPLGGLIDVCIRERRKGGAATAKQGCERTRQRWQRGQGEGARRAEENEEEHKDTMEGRECGESREKNKV